MALQRQILSAYRYRSLPESEFVRLLDSAGFAEAPAFFAAWRRDEARIDAVVEAVEPDGDGFRVVIRRTGAVPYPIPVEIERADGHRQRDTLVAQAGADTVRLPGRPGAVRLDPDGVVPMANSANPGMRSLFIEALDRAALVEPFLAAAGAHLTHHPDDAGLRRAFAQRLFELGRYEDAVAAGAPADCECRDACHAAITAARALIRLGRGPEAQVRLTPLETGARRVGAGAAWTRAWEESRGATR